jgi:hypothetical protein
MERFHFVLMKLISNHSINRDAYLDKFKHVRLLQRDLKDLRETFRIDLPFNSFEKNYTITEDERKKLVIYGYTEKKTTKKSDKFFTDFLQKYTSTIKLFQNIEKPDFLSKEEFDNFKDIIYISKYPVLKTELTNQNIEKLLDATKKFLKINFTYYITSPKNSFEVKAIPILLFFYQNRWYLMVKDIGRGNIIKKFNLDIITKLSIMPEPLQMSTAQKDKLEKEKKILHNERVKIIKELDKKGNLIQVATEETPRETLIRVDKEKAHYFAKKYDFGFCQKVEKNNDGSINVCFRFSSHDELWYTLCAWMPYIQVIKPKEYKEEFKNRVLSYLEKNDN